MGILAWIILGLLAGLIAFFGARRTTRTI